MTHRSKRSENCFAWEKTGEGLSRVCTHWTVTNQSSLFLSMLVQQGFNETPEGALPVMMST